MAAKYETRARKLLQAYFASHPDSPLAVSRIIADLSAYNVSQASIYRNLTLLENDGTLQKVAKEGTRERYYRYLKAGRCLDHLHLTCSRCGRTFHVSPDLTSALISEIKARTGFSVDQTTVLHGICPECSKSSN